MKMIYPTKVKNTGTHMKCFTGGNFDQLDSINAGIRKVNKLGRIMARSIEKTIETGDYEIEVVHFHHKKILEGQETL
jgi:hypothetical protein